MQVRDLFSGLVYSLVLLGVFILPAAEAQQRGGQYNQYGNQYGNPRYPTPQRPATSTFPGRTQTTPVQPTRTSPSPQQPVQVTWDVPEKVIEAPEQQLKSLPDLSSVDYRASSSYRSTTYKVYFAIFDGTSNFKEKSVETEVKSQVILLMAGQKPSALSFKDGKLYYQNDTEIGIRFYFHNKEEDVAELFNSTNAKVLESRLDKIAKSVLGTSSTATITPKTYPKETRPLIGTREDIPRSVVDLGKVNTIKGSGFVADIRHWPVLMEFFKKSDSYVHQKILEALDKVSVALEPTDRFTESPKHTIYDIIQNSAETIRVAEIGWKALGKDERDDQSKAYAVLHMLMERLLPVADDQKYKKAANFVNKIWIIEQDEGKVQVEANVFAAMKKDFAATSFTMDMLHRISDMMAVRNQLRTHFAQYGTRGTSALEDLDFFIEAFEKRAKSSLQSDYVRVFGGDEAGAAELDSPSDLKSSLWLMLSQVDLSAVQPTETESVFGTIREMLEMVLAGDLTREDLHAFEAWKVAQEAEKQRLEQEREPEGSETLPKRAVKTRQSLGSNEEPPPPQ